MSTYRTDFEAEVNVEFDDEAKAIEFFIQGDWQNHFFKVDAIEDVAEGLSRGIMLTPENWDSKRETFTKFVEGYGLFVETDGKYVIDSEYADGGKITAWVEREIEEVGTYVN